MKKRKQQAEDIEPKVLSEDQLRIKLENYCAYRERCAQEVRKKMSDLQIPKEEHDDYLNYLKEHGFLNDERFVQAFVRGKFRIKHWGKNKILNELRSRNIKDDKIRQSFVQIDEGDYFMSLLQLLEKKLALIKEPNTYKKQQKLYVFAMQKGYEPELIREALKTLKI